MLKPALRLILFLAFTLLFFEILFRTPLLPASYMPFSTQDPVYFIPTYDTSKARNGLYTSGSLAHFRLKWHINNDGYMYARDFFPPNQRQSKCIAIIGDSYIEGLAISYRSHMATVLQTMVGDSYAVYPFGVAGAPLSEYELILRHVCNKYDPQIIIMTISKDCIEKSVRNYFYETRMLQYEIVNDSLHPRPPVYYPHNPYVRFLRNSAFVRYITLNKELMWLNIARYQYNISHKIADTTSNEMKKEKYLQQATTRSVTNMLQTIGKRKILFVVDADRDSMYRYDRLPIPMISYRFLQSACSESSCEIFDLSPVFFREYHQHHLIVNAGDDYHWSNHGHELVAKAVFEKLTQLGWLSNER